MSINCFFLLRDIDVLFTFSHVITTIMKSSSHVLNFFFHREASEGSMKGILGYTEDDVVSTGFVGDNR